MLSLLDHLHVLSAAAAGVADVIINQAMRRGDMTCLNLYWCFILIKGGQSSILSLVQTSLETVNRFCFRHNHRVHKK